MCYWRRLSKRSIDEFEYEYTTNSSSADAALAGPSAISDSVNLFKALQVRQEPEASRQQRLSKQLGEGAQLTEQADVFARDPEAQLVCYHYAEVLVFMITAAGLLILICTIAMVCWLRVRRLSSQSRQFQHSRLASSPPLASHGYPASSCASLASPGNGSISPSILSLNESATLAARATLMRPGQPCLMQANHATSGGQQWKPLYQCSTASNTKQQSKAIHSFAISPRKPDYR